ALRQSQRTGRGSGGPDGRRPPESNARRRRCRATIGGFAHARPDGRQGDLTMNLDNIPHPAEALILSKVPAPVIERVRQLRLMAFDVDGVLTDGRLWYSSQGEQLKAFHVLDGHGLKLLLEGGIHVALITGRDG